MTASRKCGFFAAALALGLLGTASPARAESPSSWNAFVPVGETGMSARVNPLGVAVHARLLLRYRPFSPSHPIRQTSLGNALFAPTSVALMLVNDLNPAFGRMGFGIEVTPLAIWRMRAFYQVIPYFGTFANLMEFPSTRADWSPQTMKHLSKSKCCHHPALGQRILFENMLQMKLYRLVALSLFTAEGWRVPQQGTYYSGEYDLLVKSPDVVLKHVLAGGVVLIDGKASPNVVIGGFHAIGRSMVAGVQNQQAGMLVMFSPVNDQFLFYRTGMTALFGFHLQDKYKQTQPYGVLLLNFTLM